MNSADQLFLRQEILRHGSGMGSSGHRADLLLVNLRAFGFPNLTMPELREQLDYLVGEGLLLKKPSALDPATVRLVLTDKGRELI